MKKIIFMEEYESRLWRSENLDALREFIDDSAELVIGSYDTKNLIKNKNNVDFIKIPRIITMDEFEKYIWQYSEGLEWEIIFGYGFILGVCGENLHPKKYGIEKYIERNLIPWGFDNTIFPNEKSFLNILNKLKIDPDNMDYVEDFDENYIFSKFIAKTGGVIGYVWKGEDILINTIVNPLTGAGIYQTSPNPSNIGVGGNINIEGAPNKVHKAVKLIIDNALDIKGMSPYGIW